MDILFGELLPHVKENLLTHLHPNIHSEAGDIMTAIGQAMSTKKRRRKHTTVGGHVTCRATQIAQLQKNALPIPFWLY